MESLSAVDGFRYLVNLHTTMRCLSINSHLIRMLGLRDLPSSLFQNMAIKWSAELEKISENYRNRNGKLTENGKATTSFKHYLSLTKDLGLTQNLNNIYRISRLGKTLFILNIDKNPFEFELTQHERLFYLLILFQIDFDGIAILLSLFSEKQGEFSQKNIQNLFVDKLKDRLLIKQKSSDSKTKYQLLDKYNRIEYTWQNPEKYSEHIIAPRLNWLSDLALVNITKSKAYTYYTISELGKHIFSNLPFLLDNYTKDINEDWINTNLITHITLNYERRIFWKEISQNQKIDLIKEYLEFTSKEFGSIGSHRISFPIAFIYITISLFINKKILIEKEDLKNFC